MGNFNHYRVRVQSNGLKGLSGCGFKERATSLSDLFPTADEIFLPMKGCFQRVGKAASVIYEVPDLRFDAAETDRVLELAVPDPKGAHVAVIVDVLAADVESAVQMLDDIEETCQIIRARHSEVVGIIESSQEDYLQRLKDSMKFLAAELRK